MTLPQIKVLVSEVGGSNLDSPTEYDLKAATVPFDNTSNGYTADSVQAAIEEGLKRYLVTDSTGFTTSVTTDTLITGFTVTPVAGVYAVWYNAAITQSNSTAQNFWSVYKAGVQVADSERNQRCNAANSPMFQATMTVLTCNGSEAVDVRVRPNTGSITVGKRSLLLVRLGL